MARKRQSVALTPLAPGDVQRLTRLRPEDVNLEFHDIAGTLVGHFAAVAHKHHPGESPDDLDNEYPNEE